MFETNFAERMTDALGLNDPLVELIGKEFGFNKKLATALIRTVREHPQNPEVGDAYAVVDDTGRIWDTRVDRGEADRECERCNGKQKAMYMSVAPFVVKPLYFAIATADINAALARAFGDFAAAARDTIGGQLQTAIDARTKMLFELAGEHRARNHVQPEPTS